MYGAMGGGGERRLIQLDTIKLLRSFMFVRSASSVAIRLWHKNVGAVACKTKHCETHQGAGRGMSNRENGTDLEQLSYFRGGPDGRARHGRGGEHLGSQVRRNGDFDWLRPQ
jgi:hypothetical protein